MRVAEVRKIFDSLCQRVGELELYDHQKFELNGIEYSVFREVGHYGLFFKGCKIYYESLEYFISALFRLALGMEKEVESELAPILY